MLDFYCPALRLGVEVDGGVHDRPEVRAYDAARTCWLEALGIRIVRVSNEAVLHDANAVARWIVTVSPT